jgi:hypothetical protein
MNNVGPRPSFEEYLVIVDLLVLRLPVDDGIVKRISWDLATFCGTFLGFFGNIVTGKGCRPLFRPFYMYK